MIQVILAIVLWIIVIRALLKWDGECHGDCDSCIYHGADCEEERKHDKR